MVSLMAQTFVILAAGFGSRLNQLPSSIPKALIKLRNRPIIDFALDNIANYLPEIKTTIIITGYKKKLIEEYVELNASKYSFDLHCVYALDYKKGNGKSLSAAEFYVNDRFFLAMCDHLFEAPHYHTIKLESDRETDLSLCIDFTPNSHIQLEDATKVFTDSENNILRIGKNLSTWTAIDTGLFCLSPCVFKRLKQVSGKNVSVTDGVNQMIRHGDCVKGVDVSGSFWADIDTLTDLKNVEVYLSADESSRESEGE